MFKFSVGFVGYGHAEKEINKFIQYNKMKQKALYENKDFTYTIFRNNAGLSMGIKEDCAGGTTVSLFSEDYTLEERIYY